ncbi:aliphatic nitrilase [Aureobasidium melanogenum CBS 110374]|uniref:nitrilase n=1 Tax=Aureobasidium melanogenum (strain CBS 110374) TaxID=1043003 RepID=A0A074VC27_AURM1|nr:aliphatic nitrilase [Aureobasidium melanogenum CBS 110374]KEQ57913.1 aliphatic nitrilase [Aureobasidium melanogenum CBS 110374]
MSATGQKLKVAAIQAEPAWNDLEGGVNKSIALIEQAAAQGAQVIGFPEVFIPGYPWSIWAHGPIDNASFMDEYFRNSLERDSPEMKRICAAVKEAGVFVVLGYSERYRGTLYIAQSFINENGVIVHHRRKIKPTHVERAYYGDGQGESLQTVVPSTKLPDVRIGGLNCWEHTQTLLRYYEYEQNVDGACYVAVATQVMTRDSFKRCRVDNFAYANNHPEHGGGFSMIYNPWADELVERLDPSKEGILIAEVDLSLKRLAKQNLDVVGHYCRPDQLSLRVNKHAARAVHYAADP